MILNLMFRINTYLLDEYCEWFYCYGRNNKKYQLKINRLSRKLENDINQLFVVFS